MYSIAFAAVSGLQRLPEGLTQPLIPSLSVLVGTGERERLAGATARAFRLIWSVGVPLAAALMTMGPLALRLVYGNSYRAAGDVVVVLAAALPIVLLSRVGAAVLHAFGRVSTLLACLALAVSADAVACVLLVPAHGSVGAAIANVVGQVVAATLEIWCAARAMGAGVLRLPWVQMARATAVSAAGAAAAYAVASSFPSAWGLLAALVAGAAVFAAAFWLIPTVAVEDLAWLDGITATRFGGRLRPVVRTLWRRAAGGTAPALDGPSG
jgi:O-antigen/teichoic acid export membrane protein